MLSLYDQKQGKDVLSYLFNILLVILMIIAIQVGGEGIERGEGERKGKGRSKFDFIYR